MVTARNIVAICLVLSFSTFFYTGSVTYSAESEVDMMLDNLHWLGHASFRLDGSKVIYFDPWKLSKNAIKANIILVTHEHFDHFSLDDIKLISTKDTVIVADQNVVGKLKSAKVIYKEIRPLSAGDSTDLDGVKIDAVSSYNTNKQFHTKESKKLGFIVTVGDIKIYHAGDTDVIPEMNRYSCDIALLPVSGTYVMTADEAASAAMIIKPKVAIPMHYGDIIGADSDAKIFQEILNGKIEVKILQKES